MQKLKSYIAALFLALLLFPLAEKVQHELGHFEEEHCGISETHFCQAEHSCTICDYVFAASTTPSSCNEQLLIFLNKDANISFRASDSNLSSNSFFGVLLRGPPATA